MTSTTTNSRLVDGDGSAIFHDADETDGMTEMRTRIPRSTSTPGKRLQHARLQAGFKTAADAARSIGANVETYQAHERGGRSISRKAAARYAERFNCLAGYILYGEQLQRIPHHGVTFVGSHDVDMRPGNRQAVSGRVVSNGNIQLAEVADYIPSPLEATANLARFHVITTELGNVYRRGDHVYYDPDTFNAPINPSLISGRDCVVMLRNRQLALRFVVIDYANRATLYTYGENRQPDISVRIEHAAPVLWIERSISGLHLAA